MLKSVLFGNVVPGKGPTVFVDEAVLAPVCSTAGFGL